MLFQLYSFHLFHLPFYLLSIIVKPLLSQYLCLFLHIKYLRRVMHLAPTNTISILANNHLSKLLQLILVPLLQFDLQQSTFILEVGHYDVVPFV
jgi:hypothetical protein